MDTEAENNHEMMDKLLDAQVPVSEAFDRLSAETGVFKGASIKRIESQVPVSKIE
jgi:hypothetical protein